MSWKNVTIENYIALKAAMNGQFDSEELKAFTILSALHGKPAEYFESIPIKDLAQLIKSAEFIYNPEATSGVPSTIRVGGRKYNVQYDMSRLISGQYIDLTGYTRSVEIIDKNYHNIISLFLSPRDMFGRDVFKRMLNAAKTKDELIHVHSKITEKRQEIAENLRVNMTMDRVFQLSNYFFLLLQNLTKGTQDYLNREKKKAMKNLNKVLRKNGMPSIGVGL